jgi:ATP-dependent Clp protease protease subunit
MTRSRRLKTPDLLVRASVRPPPIAARSPAKMDIAAFTPPEAFDRWNAGVQAAGEVGANVITIYDVIGADYLDRRRRHGEAGRRGAALRSAPRTSRCTSTVPGGDMFEGIAIYNRLLEHPARSP